MIKGTSLDSLCELGNTSESLRSKLKGLFEKEFTTDEAIRRADSLKEKYDNMVNGEKMLELIYKL
jgi:hypothetical protein